MLSDHSIQLGMLMVALVSIIISGGSLWFTYVQWQKIKNKIGMIKDIGKAMEVLPAWYTGRMMSDFWVFGLLTADGRTLVVSQIKAVSDDGEWLDVELASKDQWSWEEKPNHIFAVAHDRTSASVHVSCIVAAVELITS